MNYIRSTKIIDRSDLIKDGWVITKEGTEEMPKWVLSNPKYNYRRFYYSRANRRKRHLETYEYLSLLQGLAIDIERGIIELPYAVKAGGANV